MRLVGVNAAIGEQAEQMQAASAGAGVFHGGEHDGIGEELAVLDHELDARAVHVHDASGADVKVAHLAVAHLTVRQSDGGTAGLD